MDLNTISEIVRPRSRDTCRTRDAGDAWLAGGTWLFSVPQPGLQRLVDLQGLDWTPLEVSDAGLGIAATCTIATLETFEAPPAWTAAALIGQCCQAFLASFKVQTVATVGGNLCMSLPAGPMISLCAALEGTCLIWMPDGGERHVPAAQFVLDDQKNALAPGELLRRIDLPREALGRRCAFRRMSLTPLGRSSVLLIGTFSAAGSFQLTVTASTRRPVQLAFAAVPGAGDLAARIDAEIPVSLYFDDVHGRPDWRRHMTLLFAEEIRAELSGPRA